MNSEPEQSAAPEIPEVPLERHHHEHESEEHIAVLKWLPKAIINTANGDFMVWDGIGEGEEHLFPAAATEREAWKNAFTAMQQVNAYFLWKNSGGLGSAFDNWIDAMWDLENGPYVPNPNIPPSE